MVDTSAAPSSPAPRPGVVRSLARAADRPCSRPSCPAPARATLSFSYASSEAFLDRLVDDADPQRYDLCARHATRTEPPRGWSLVDRRPDEDRDEVEPPVVTSRDLASDETIAVLAAALRAVPDVAPAPVTAVHPPAVAARVPASTEPGSPVVPDAPNVVSAEDDARRRVLDEPTVELPVVRVPRPVPAAGDRHPATDW